MKNGLGTDDNVAPVQSSTHARAPTNGINSTGRLRIEPPPDDTTLERVARADRGRRSTPIERAIARALSDPTLSPDALERIFGLEERDEARRAKAAFSAALV